MKYIFFLFSIFLFINSQSQTPEILWQNCFGSNIDGTWDKAFGAIETENGFMFAIKLEGETPEATNYHGSNDIWIINTDSIGNIIWEKCYGGTSGDIPRKLLKISNNEYLICGYTFSNDGDVQSGNYGESDNWIVKIDNIGNIIWERTYGSSDVNSLSDIILTPDGGFIFIDRIDSSGGDISEYFGAYDAWLCKCDALGNIEWEKTLGNEGLDHCMALMINSNGNIIMLGGTQIHGGMVECYPDEIWMDVWLVELDLQGNILTQHCYGGSYYDLGNQIIEIENGYLFTGYVSSNDGDVSGLHGPPGGHPEGWNDIWLVKLNDQFEIIWQNCIGGTGGDYSCYLSLTSDNNIFILGSTFSHDGDVSYNHSWEGYNQDIWAIQLSSEGEIEWEQCYGGVEDEYLYYNSVIKKSDNNYIIAGNMRHGPSYDVECYSYYNTQAWLFEIAFPDTSNNSVNEIAKKIINVYPNPAKDYVIFETDKTTQSGNIHIINTFGETVKELSISGSKTVWDCRNTPNGIYFYTYSLNGIKGTGKLCIYK